MYSSEKMLAVKSFCLLIDPLFVIIVSIYLYSDFRVCLSKHIYSRDAVKNVRPGPESLLQVGVQQI